MIRSINSSMEFSGTFETVSTIDKDKMLQIIGADFAKANDEWSLSSQKLIQRRKHKKYRTNKKWAKRYGYITKTKDLGPFGIDKLETTGDITTINFICKGEN